MTDTPVIDRPAAIRGCYSDYRRVKGRKVLQLVIEVPIEQAPEVHNIFGEPSPDGSTWVAVALLDPNVARATPSEASQKPKGGGNGNGAGKPTRPLETLPRAQQAGILCGTEAFTTYLLDMHEGQVVVDEDMQVDAAATLRRLCGVGSRRDLDSLDDAAALFDRLRDDYRFWLDNP